MAFSWNPFNQNGILGKIWKSGDDALDTGERIKFLLTTVVPFFTGKVHEDSPEFVKATVSADLGGPTSFADENFMDEVDQALPDDAHREAGTDFIQVAFPIDDPDPFISRAARAQQEWFRMLLLSKVSPAKTTTKKFKDVLGRDNKGKETSTSEWTEEVELTAADKSAALGYWTRITKSVIDETVSVAREKGYMSARATRTDLHLTPEQFTECRIEACQRVVRQLHNKGVAWMPLPEDKPFISKVRGMFVSRIMQFWRDRMPVWWRFVRRKGRKHGKAAVAATKKTAVAADAALAARADSLRTDRERRTGQRLRRKDGFFNRINPNNYIFRR